MIQRITYFSAWKWIWRMVATAWKPWWKPSRAVFLKVFFFFARSVKKSSTHGLHRLSKTRKTFWERKWAVCIRDWHNPTPPLTVAEWAMKSRGRSEAKVPQLRWHETIYFQGIEVITIGRRRKKKTERWQHSGSDAGTCLRETLY